MIPALTAMITAGIEYDGASPESLKANMQNVVDIATGNSILTGDGEATVDSYEFTIC
jgi:hypothetical protein